MPSIIIESSPRRSRRVFQRMSGIDPLRYAINKAHNLGHIELSRDVETMDVDKLKRLGQDFLTGKHDIGNIGVKKPWLYRLNVQDLAKRINYDLPDRLEDELSPRLHIPHDPDVPSRTDEVIQDLRRRSNRGTKKNKKKRKKQPKSQPKRQPKSQPKRQPKKQSKKQAKRESKRESKRQNYKPKMLNRKK